MTTRIDPGLFTRVMALPDAAREDLLEFLGGSPIDDTCLEILIERFAEEFSTGRSEAAEPN